MKNLRDRIRRRVDRLDPDAALRRFAHAHKRRRVDTDLDGHDGLVALHAYLPPVEGLAVSRRLDQLAGTFDRDDGRSKDERIADALIGCVLGFAPDLTGQPAKVPIVINVTVDLPTLLALQANPAELGGYGPIPPELTRSLAADATWQRFVHDPVDGHLLDRGHTRYTPDAELERYLRARDLNCRFPGSTRTTRLDLDHNEPWDHSTPAAGGTTSADDMAALEPLLPPGQDPRRLHRHQRGSRPAHLDDPARTGLPHPSPRLPTGRGQLFRRAALTSRTGREQGVRRTVPDPSTPPASPRAGRPTGPSRRAGCTRSSASFLAVRQVLVDADEAGARVPLVGKEEQPGVRAAPTRRCRRRSE